MNLPLTLTLTQTDERVHTGSNGVLGDDCLTLTISLHGGGAQIDLTPEQADLLAAALNGSSPR